MSAVLTNIYNHYLTTYAPKSTTQYDSHKKSELRGVYNSIVKLNKDAPWYLPVNSSEAQQFAVNLKENARSLHNTIASMGGLNRAQLLGQKAAYSDREDIVSASYIGEQNAPEPPPSIEIEVQKLASSQEHIGSYLPDVKTKLPIDTYSFDISINDLNYEFQFSIKEGETNKDVQERLVRLINNADIGISASLNEFHRESAIRLTSDATGLPFGKDILFAVSDDHTSKSAGTVAYFGLDQMSRAPENASILINGEARTLSSNNFTIEKTYELKLNSISAKGETACIGVKDNVPILSDSINTLIGGYNSFVKAASDYSLAHPKSGQLATEMGHLAFRYKNELESMGMTIQRDNTILVDDGLMQEAVSEEHRNDSLDVLMKFSSSLVRKAAQVSINPMDYVSKTVVAYKNPARSFPNPYITSAYSGMMFNSYC